MIKPATLWGLFKTCDDSKWIGDICRALGGQGVELEYGQKMMVKSIQLDSGWLDEAVEAQRQKWREKKRGQRGTFETSGDNGEMSPVPECSPPSVLPSVHPSIQTNNMSEGGAHPSREVVVAISATTTIPKEYASWWYDQMEAAGWVDTQGRLVGHRNWRAVLMAWHRREKPQAIANIKAEAGVATTQAEEYDENPNHWKHCVNCYWLYECGYGCKYSKRPPAGACINFKSKEGAN